MFTCPLSSTMFAGCFAVVALPKFYVIELCFATCDAISQNSLAILSLHHKMFYSEYLSFVLGHCTAL